MQTHWQEHDDDDGDQDLLERPAPFLTNEDHFERGAALDGLKIRVQSQAFRHGRVTAVLSGVTVDLRDATLSPEGATIHVQSALSGIDILVPQHWLVECAVDAVCGGIDGGRPPIASDRPAPRLRVTGTVVAGGLCVR